MQHKKELQMWYRKILRSALRFIFFIIVLLTRQNVFAQQPSVETTVDKTSIVIGEQFRMTFESNSPLNGFKVQWLHIPDSIAHFEVINRSLLLSSDGNGQRTYSQTYIFTSFDSGEFTVPAYRIRFEPIGGTGSYDLYTDSLKINVGYSPADSVLPFHNIKGVIPVKNEFPLWIILAIIDAVLLLIIIILLYLKSRKKKPVNISDSTLSPYEEAIMCLKELGKITVYKREDVKVFYTRLTEIFKKYLSRKTSKNVSSLTSEELLVFMKDKGYSYENISSVANSFKMSDAVKFAKYLPPQDEHEKVLQQMRDVVVKIENTVTETKK
ncbi:hypothetical protein BH09BAC2_BH09BAC2_07520 [soil metagenome]